MAHCDLGGLIVSYYTRGAPVWYFHRGQWTMLPPGEKAQTPAARCLADDLATLDYYTNGPAPEHQKPAPVAFAMKAAKPAISGLGMVNQGRFG